MSKQKPLSVKKNAGKKDVASKRRRYTEEFKADPCLTGGLV